MTPVYVNAVATALPTSDMHTRFLALGPRMLRERQPIALFTRMAARSGVEHRYSVLTPDPDPDGFDAEGLYRLGAFPDTGRRMQIFERTAPDLAARAADGLGPAARGATHLVVACCTGFSAPGVDFLLAERLGLRAGVERSVIGFMGCSAALNALKAAWHIVRSDRAARVLVVNLELCSLHFRETTVLEEMLSYMIFADGCTAALVSAEPAGALLEGFRSLALPETQGHITWRIGADGFVMHLSGALPAAVAQGVADQLPGLLDGAGPGDIRLWAVHPGGRSILDAVARGIGQPIDLSASREVLRTCGNMSSATVMFVLRRLMEDPTAEGMGCMLAFGPGVTVEAARFRKPG